MSNFLNFLSLEKPQKFLFTFWKIFHSWSKWSKFFEDFTDKRSIPVFSESLEELRQPVSVSRQTCFGEPRLRTIKVFIITLRRIQESPSFCQSLSMEYTDCVALTAVAAHLSFAKALLSSTLPVSILSLALLYKLSPFYLRVSLYTNFVHLTFFTFNYVCVFSVDFYTDWSRVWLIYYHGSLCWNWFDGVWQIKSNSEWNTGFKTRTPETRLASLTHSFATTYK